MTSLPVTLPGEITCQLLRLAAALTGCSRLLNTRLTANAGPERTTCVLVCVVYDVHVCVWCVCVCMNQQVVCVCISMWCVFRINNVKSILIHLPHHHITHHPPLLPSPFTPLLQKYPPPIPPHQTHAPWMWKWVQYALTPCLMWQQVPGGCGPLQPASSGHLPDWDWHH